MAKKELSNNDLPVSADGKTLPVAHVLCRRCAENLGRHWSYLNSTECKHAYACDVCRSDGLLNRYLGPVPEPIAKPKGPGFWARLFESATLWE